MLKVFVHNSFPCHAEPCSIICLLLLCKAPALGSVKALGKQPLLLHQTSNLHFMSTMYTNLVFEGSGVKGIAYAGALEVLNQENILPNITKVAGTSAGTITACVLSLGYSAADIKTTVMEMNFNSFEDGWDPLRIPQVWPLPRR